VRFPRIWISAVGSSTVVNVRLRTYDIFRPVAYSIKGVENFFSHSSSVTLVSLPHLLDGTMDTIMNIHVETRRIFLDTHLQHMRSGYKRARPSFRLYPLDGTDCWHKSRLSSPCDAKRNQTQNNGSNDIEIYIVYLVDSLVTTGTSIVSSPLLPFWRYSWRAFHSR
jgi:hypothetical protein